MGLMAVGGNILNNACKGFLCLEMGEQMFYPASQESIGLGGNRGESRLARAEKIREEVCRTDWRDRLGPPWTSG